MREPDRDGLAYKHAIAPAANQPAGSYGWHAVGDTFYRWIDVYKWRWAGVAELEHIPLDSALVAVAGDSSAVAVTRHPQKLDHLGDVESATTPAVLLTPAGSVLCTFEISTTLVGWGWAAGTALLICVFADGRIELLSAVGRLATRRHALAPDGSAVHVSQAAVAGRSVAALLSDWTVLLLDDAVSPAAARARRVVTEWPMAPDTFVVVPATARRPRAHALCGVAGALLQVGAVGAPLRELAVDAEGPYRLVQVSPCGELVALVSAEQELVVASADFETVFLHTRLAVAGASREVFDEAHVQWCGSDVLVALMGDAMVVVGPDAGAKAIPRVPRGARLFATLGGLVALYPGGASLFERVPAALEAVARPGSTGPGSLVHGGAKVTPDVVPAAIDALLAAACDEFSIERQQRLAGEANGARAQAVSGYNRAAYREYFSRLAVLNTLRSAAGVGWPLAAARFSLEPALELLISRRAFGLALACANALDAPLGSRERIVAAFAVDAVLQRTGTPEAAAVPAIVRERASLALRVAVGAGLVTPNLPAAQLARLALRLGARDAATALFAADSRPLVRVALLLAIGEHALALSEAAALASREPTSLVLADARESLPTRRFFDLLRSAPAPAVFAHLASSDPTALRDHYFQDDQRLATAQLALAQARAAPQDDNETDSLLSQAAEALAASRVAPRRAAALQSAVRLRDRQRELDAEFGQLSSGAFLGTSVAQTLRMLVGMGQSVRAAALAREFGVSSARLFWVCISVWAAHQDRPEALRQLERLSQQRPLPVPPADVVSTLIRAGCSQGAHAFVPRCPLEMQPLLLQAIERGALSEV